METVYINATAVANPTTNSVTLGTYTLFVSGGSVLVGPVVRKREGVKESSVVDIYTGGVSLRCIVKDGVNAATFRSNLLTAMQGAVV